MLAIINTIITLSFPIVFVLYEFKVKKRLIFDEVDLYVFWTVIFEVICLLSLIKCSSNLFPLICIWSIGLCLIFSRGVNFILNFIFVLFATLICAFYYDVLTVWVIPVGLQIIIVFFLLTKFYQRKRLSLKDLHTRLIYLLIGSIITIRIFTTILLSKNLVWMNNFNMNNLNTFEKLNYILLFTLIYERKFRIFIK